jgi:hypothetical protein
MLICSQFPHALIAGTSANKLRDILAETGLTEFFKEISRSLEFDFFSVVAQFKHDWVRRFCVRHRRRLFCRRMSFSATAEAAQKRSGGKADGDTMD